MLRLESGTCGVKRSDTIHRNTSNPGRCPKSGTWFLCPSSSREAYTPRSLSAEFQKDTLDDGWPHRTVSTFGAHGSQSRVLFDSWSRCAGLESIGERPSTAGSPHSSSPAVSCPLVWRIRVCPVRSSAGRPGAREPDLPSTASFRRRTWTVPGVGPRGVEGRLEGSGFRPLSRSALGIGRTALCGIGRCRDRSPRSSLKECARRRAGLFRSFGSVSGTGVSGT